MTATRTIFIAFLGVACADASRPAPPASDNRPNIIIVMPDDMGYGDLGVTGNPVIRTPHLNRFASESAELTSFYVSPVCSPTRACLMTGRYNYRTRVVDTFKGRSMMDPEEVTLAEVLRGAGYTTGIFGKWHLGDNHPLRPQDQGFDEVLVHKGGGLAQPSEPIENRSRYTDPILFHNGRQVQSQGYCTDIFFEAAMDFIKDAVEQGKPFFAYVPPNAPHGPFHDVPAALLKHYQSVDLDPVLGDDKTGKHRDTVARVYAMVENIDENMGRLDAFLMEQGLKQNTIVLFFTDNGPNTRRYVGPFRGMKTEVHDGGIRTCFYARWPGEFPAEHRSDQIAAHIDVMPTLLDAAGVAAPVGVTLDGRSVLPLLKGTPGDWPDRTLFLQSHRGDAPVAEHHIAVRSQEWGLVHPSGFHREALSEDIPFELYRIMEDPGQRHDLAGELPERVTVLRQAYARWFNEVSSTRTDNFAPPRISIGSAAEPLTELSIQDWRVSKNTQGWGSGGVWHVSVFSPGPYQVEVQFESAPGGRTLELFVGDRHFEGRLEADAVRLSIDSVTLQPGDTTVRVRSTPPFERNAMMRFVTFRRK